MSSKVPPYYVDSSSYCVLTREGGELKVVFKKEGGKLWSAYVLDIDDDDRHYNCGCRESLTPSLRVAVQLAKQATKYWNEQERESEH